MILPGEQVPNETYKHGQRIKAYIVEVTSNKFKRAYFHVRIRS